VLAELANPLAWGSLAVGRLFPIVELGDLYRFSANGREFTDDTDLAVIGFTHSIGKNGGATKVEIRGTAPSQQLATWTDRFTGRGTSAVGPSGTSVSSPTPTVTTEAGAVRITWALPIGRLNESLKTVEIHIASGTSFAANSTNFHSLAYGNEIMIPQSDIPAGYGVRIRLRDRYRLTGTVSTGVAIESMPCFAAHRTGSGGTAIGTTSTKVECNIERWDNNADYSTTLYRFVAPVAGRYQFNAAVRVSSSVTSIVAYLYKNGGIYHRGNTTAGVPAGTIIAGVSGMIELAANNYVEFFAEVLTGSSVPNTGTYFDGYLVQAT